MSAAELRVGMDQGCEEIYGSGPDWLRRVSDPTKAWAYTEACGARDVDISAELFERVLSLIKSGQHAEALRVKSVADAVVMKQS